MGMAAEIISIGTELTSGAKLDTNSQWLSLQLAEIGIGVHYHSTMADDLEAMVAVFRTAVERCDVVLITGGLGPTLDDLTRHAVAGLLGTELILHEPSLEKIKSMFARRGRHMPESNVIQAQFPEGTEPIQNPRGTAPGIWSEVIRQEKEPCRLAVMPGVPSEMKRMYLKQIRHRLPVGDRVIRYACVNCFGIGESHAEELLGDLTRRGRDPEVGITVHNATITLRIVAHGNDDSECDQKIHETRQLIHERMGEWVFGQEDEELEHVLVRELKQQQKTLATIDYATGGVLASKLLSVPDVEESFLGGLTSPHVAALKSLLGIEQGILDSTASCSIEMAKALASACRSTFDSDYALAFTAWKTEVVSDGEAPVPQCYLALATRENVEVHPHIMVGDWTITKSRAAKAALDLLRRHLLAMDSPS